MSYPFHVGSVGGNGDRSPVSDHGGWTASRRPQEPGEVLDVITSSNLYPAGTLRPDLPIPMAPGAGWCWRLQVGLLGLRELEFGEIRHRITRVTVFATALAIATQFVVSQSARPLMLAIVGVVVAYALVTGVCLVSLRRRQERFEPEWLAAQSEVLRDRQFDILRFTVSRPASTPDGCTTIERSYDLTRTEHVASLMQLRGKATVSGRPVLATVEFVHPTAEGNQVAVERVRADLGSVQLIEQQAANAVPRVSFPAARYRAEPPAGLSKRGTPQRVTYWILGPPRIIVPVTRQASTAAAVPPMSGARSG